MELALSRHLLLCLVGGCTAVATPEVVPPVEEPAPQAASQTTAETKRQAAAVEQKPTLREPPAPVAAAKPPAPAVTSKPPAAATARTQLAKPVPSPAPPTAKPPPAPTLDLGALKQELKDTDAIGVITKLSLKNQVDDLLQQFRDYYDGKTKVTLQELRRSYDALLMKVLSLVQDKDTKLATSIVASREPIWGLLSDQKKFSALQV